MPELGLLRERLDHLHQASPAERAALREWLLDQLRSGSMPIRAVAAQGLGRVGDERVVAPLIAALRDPAPLVQWHAAHALRALSARALVTEDRLLFHDGAAFESWKRALLDRLVADLNDPATAVRFNAATSLGEIGTAATLRGLVDAAGDGEAPVREAVQQAILVLVGRDPALAAPTRAYLAPALRDGEPLVRRTAVDLLGHLGDRGAVPDLLLLLHDPAPSVRESACVALGRLGDPAGSAGLIARLADDDPAVRALAAGALGQIGDPYAAPPLVQIAGDESPVVRRAVARALGCIGGPLGQAGLLRTLRDKDAGTRLEAIRALGLCGDRGALKPLAALLRDRTTLGDVRLDREAAAAGKAVAARLRQRGG